MDVTDHRRAGRTGMAGGFYHRGIFYGRHRDAGFDGSDLVGLTAASMINAGAISGQQVINGPSWSSMGACCGRKEGADPNWLPLGTSNAEPVTGGL
jgi:hypothetical protein